MVPAGTMAPQPRAGRGAVVTAGFVVLLWRLAALRWPSSLVDIPDGLRLPMAALGGIFLGSGVLAWWFRPDRYTRLLMLYGLGGGIHWGGAVGAPGEGLEWTLFFAYLAPTALADAALLHLSLVYPGERHLGRGRRVVLYAPGIAALIALPVAVVLPVSLRHGVAAVILLVANLFSLAAGFIFLSRLFTMDRSASRAGRLPLIAAGLVAASLLALLGAGGLLPGAAEGWNLVLGAVPLCLAIALATRADGASSNV